MIVTLKDFVQNLHKELSIGAGGVARIDEHLVGIEAITEDHLIPNDAYFTEGIKVAEVAYTYEAGEGAEEEVLLSFYQLPDSNSLEVTAIEADFGEDDSTVSRLTVDVTKLDDDLATFVKHSLFTAPQG